ncbi:hypothetical protein ALC62_08480 [Cyphomyrmex costatus]|uniref:Uncharacterized protein n=1 Tax=Cyphomyrmex costatus TaxID=456900 RepID=A0A195CK23_9HYME|nr:hypothetical protein ALC62_08480 [Cyphomyrmex costatus]
MLVAHSEQFAVHLSSAESQLHLSGIFIRLEGQRIFDVTLGLESSWDRRCHATGTGPTGIALAFCLGEAADASAMFPATEGRFLIVANLLRLRATSDAVPRKTRVSKVVQFAVVEQILDATVEAFAHRHMFPLVMRWIELLYVETADLQRCVYVQVLVERGYSSRSLTTGIIEFWRASILQLRYFRGFAVVDDELHVPDPKSISSLGIPRSNSIEIKSVDIFSVIKFSCDKFEAQMAVIAHFQSGIPGPSVASETSGGLLTPRTVIARWTLTSRIDSPLLKFRAPQVHSAITSTRTPTRAVLFAFTMYGRLLISRVFVQLPSHISFS